MIPTDFQNQVATDPQLSVLLWEAAQNSGLGESDDQTYTTGLESIVAVWACYALFYWSKMVLNARQRQLEMDTVQQQIELIQLLVADGWPREQAQAMVLALLNGIKARQDDPAFKAALDKALELVGKD